MDTDSCRKKPVNKAIINLIPVYMNCLAAIHSHVGYFSCFLNAFNQCIFSHVYTALKKSRQIHNIGDLP
jgi:hypothetical protein